MTKMQTRIAELAQQAETRNCQQTDRMFAGLLLFQWLAGIAVAYWVSPLTWEGLSSSTHVHLWSAVLLGGAIISLPLWLVLTRAGAPITRHVVAVAQMLASALLIHLSGGRLETHFHVFGSLAFLSFYRDWRVLLTGTVVVAADHFFGGLYWPESVYGVASGANWLWLEHSAWVVFIDFFLVYSCLRGRKEMWALAERQATLEDTNATIEQTVCERTRDLQEKTVELQQRSSELQESFKFNQAIVDTALDAVVGMDPQGHITSWNSQAEQIFGYSSQEATGRLLSETIIPQNLRSSHEAGFRRFQTTGISKLLNNRIEITALRRDGQEFPVELAIAPIQDGTKASFCAFVRDITDRVQAAESLCRAKEAAELANRAKSEFLANMSHEIRTPMNGILGMTELLLDTVLTPEQHESLDLVKSSSESLMRVINDILDYSKIEAGKLDLDPIEFQLRDALEDTLKTLALRAHRKGLELTCDIASNVPERVVGDPGRLRQIVVNLVGNAIKFTEAGEVVVRARIESQTADGFELGFEVVDTGVGIPADKQQLIFDPFSQADGSTTRRFGGTGLGLTISSRLVDLMGGRIGLRSEVGRGSTFHFNTHFGRPQTVAAASSTASPAMLKGLRVLVVDDNATNRRVLTGILRMWGTRPTAVESGAAAVDELRRAAQAGEAYPLLLTDAMMPEMDGFMLVEQLRSESGLAPRTIMMLTSADRQSDTARCRKLGMAAYLVKPVKADELQLAILAAMSGVNRANRTAQATSTASAETTNDSATSRSLRILLAEDNPVNQRVALHILHKGGHSVVAVGNGREAVEALAREEFAVVLMDVQMPEMDGFEATNAIRLNEQITGRHIPIIAMTAHAMKGDRERCLEAGMDDYIAKPVRAADLLKLIQTVVGSAIVEEAHASQPTPDHGRPIFDRETALERVGGEDDLLEEVIQLFLTDAPNRIAEVRAAVEEADAKRLKNAAHSLKGSSAYVGAERASASARQLEELAGGDLSAIREGLRQLEREMEQFQRAVVEAAPRAQTV